MPELSLVAVRSGVADTVPVRYAGGFSYLSLNGEDFQQIEKKILVPEELEAPVKAGEVAGVLRYELGGKVLGEVEILVDGDVAKAGYGDYLRRLMKEWLMGRSEVRETDEISTETAADTTAENAA